MDVINVQEFIVWESDTDICHKCATEFKVWKVIGHKCFYSFYK